MPQSQSPFMVEVETDSDAQDFNQHLYDGDDLVDLRSNAAVLQAGDLVEIRWGERRCHKYPSPG